MAARKPNDGRGKFGGRQKGTPNRIPAIVRGGIAKVLSDYFSAGEDMTEDEVAQSFAKDIGKLEPRVRVLAMERYVGYVVPKLQTTTLEMAVESKKTIEDRLAELSEEKK